MMRTFQYLKGGSSKVKPCFTFVKKAHANSRRNPFLKRWTNYALSLLFVVSALTIQGQHAIVPGHFIEGRYPTFDPLIMTSHGIAAITIRLMRKPSSRTIYDDGKRIVYRFDATGNLQAFQKILPGDFGRMDTLSTTFIRHHDQLKTTSERVGSYRKRITHSYPNDSTTIETIRVKRGALDWQDIATEQVLMKSKRSKNFRTLTEERGGIDAKPYQRIISTFSDVGIESRVSWLAARPSITENWTYEHGRIAEYSFANLVEQSSFRVTYRTDVDRQDEGTWCEEGKCRNWSMVYFDNGLPKGWIIIDPSTQDLEIWEFRYDYR